MAGIRRRARSARPPGQGQPEIKAKVARCHLAQIALASPWLIQQGSVHPDSAMIGAEDIATGQAGIGPTQMQI